MGNGHWLRGQTEHCIYATRGKPVVTLTDQTTLLHAPVRGHSVKPVEFYELVEKLCPAPRYADLFSRYRHNDKWDCHGDEAPPTSDSGTPTKEAALRATIGPDLAIPGFLQRPKVGASCRAPKIAGPKAVRNLQLRMRRAALFLHGFVVRYRRVGRGISWKSPRRLSCRRLCA
jgi:hypothetical protein